MTVFLPFNKAPMALQALGHASTKVSAEEMPKTTTLNIKMLYINLFIVQKYSLISHYEYRLEKFAK